MGLCSVELIALGDRFGDDCSFFIGYGDVAQKIRSK